MKNTTKIILCGILILFMSAPIIYLLVLFIDKVLLNKFNWLIVEGTKDSWISFAGSIIGGFITMLVLYFTVKQSNMENENNNIKSVRPFILVTPELNNDFDESIDTDCNGCQYVIDTTVENISNNLVKDLVLEKELVYIYNSSINDFELLDPDKDNYAIYTVLYNKQDMIKPNGVSKFHTNFIINNYSDALEDNAVCFKVVTTYRYKDVMDYVEYKHYFEYELNINYSRDGKFSLFAQDIKNNLVEEKRI